MKVITTIATALTCATIEDLHLIFKEHQPKKDNQNKKS